jgi:hypothetical protein
MIPFPGNARVWISMGQTDMRRGMDALARQVQHGLGATRIAAISISSGADKAI